MSKHFNTNSKYGLAIGYVNFNHEIDRYDPVINLGSAIVINACQDWLQSIKWLRQHTSNYKMVVESPEKALDYFLQKAKGGIYHSTWVQKEKRGIYEHCDKPTRITRLLTPKEFCDNVEKYAGDIYFSCEKPEEHSEVFNRLTEILEIEHFFKSSWCEELCGIDGRLILRKLKSGDISEKELAVD